MDFFSSARRVGETTPGLCRGLTPDIAPLKVASNEIMHSSVSVALEARDGTKPISLWHLLAPQRTEVS